MAVVVGVVVAVMVVLNVQGCIGMRTVIAVSI